MNTEVLDQNVDVYFMLKNKSFFVYTTLNKNINAARNIHSVYPM